MAEITTFRSENNDKMFEKMHRLASKNNELEADLREAKESIEFLSNELSILSETYKECEDALQREADARKEDRKTYEELASKANRLFEKVDGKNNTISELNATIVEKDRKIESLKDEANKAVTFNNSIFNECLKYKQDLSEILNVETGDTTYARHIESLPVELSKLNELIKDTFKLKTSEIEMLKEDITKLVEENYSIKSELKSKCDKVVQLEDKLKESNKAREYHEGKIKFLSDELDMWIEKYRCSQALNIEMENEVKDLMAKDGVNSKLRDSIVLRQELAKSNELLRVKEELLQKMIAKYNRHRKVWEDNERKADLEIKKLDEVIDKVIAELKSNHSFLDNCLPLKQLLLELTEQESQS